MKLPELRSGQAQRLTTPNPEVAAAPARAIGRVGEIVGGEIDKFIEEREKQSSAADYTHRLGEIESANQDVVERLQETPYMRVTDLPGNVEVPKGSITNRYDPETDTIVEFVATDEISGDIYQGIMSEAVAAQSKDARNDLVSARLESDAINIMRSSRAALFKDHLIKSRARDTAKFSLELDRAVQSGDERRVMQVVSRAGLALGINEADALKAAQSEMDKQHFIKGADTATTVSEVAALQTQLREKNWRFDSDTYKSTSSMLIKRETALDTLETEELTKRQDAAYVDALLVASTDGMTSDQLGEFKWLKPSQFNALRTVAQTDAKTFSTPEQTRLWVDTKIQSVARGGYSDTTTFDAARQELRTALEGMVGSFDPFNGENYEQKISAADYAKYSNQIDALEQIGYQNKQYSVGRNQIYIMVTGASEEAFTANFDANAERQIALYDALNDYDQYIDGEGPKAEPMDWITKNLYKYTSGPAKASLMGIDSQYSNMRDMGITWTEDGLKIDYDSMKTSITQSLKNARATNNQSGIDNARGALQQLDSYKQAYPLNVR